MTAGTPRVGVCLEAGLLEVLPSRAVLEIPLSQRVGRRFCHILEHAPDAKARRKMSPRTKIIGPAIGGRATGNFATTTSISSTWALRAGTGPFRDSKAQ